MDEDASCSKDNRKAVSTIKPELVHSMVRQPQQYQANSNEGKRAPRDVMAASHPRLETGDTAINVPVSGYKGPLGDVSSSGASNPLDVVTKGGPDNDGAKGSPGVTTEAPSELKELDSLPGLPAEGATLQAEKGPNSGPEGDVLGMAEGEDKNKLVSGSDLKCVREDAREGGGCGERSASILAAEGRDGLASPRDPCHKAGEPVGAYSTGGGCSAPERRNAGAPIWQQPRQGTRLPSKVASKHRPLSPRACSVWDMDSLSDEEDGVSGGREDAAAEELAEEDTEGAREISVEARGVVSALPQRSEVRGKAFEMPPPKRVRVEERPINSVGEDNVAEGNDNSGRGSTSTSREDGGVALAMAEANEKARQLMPPPPPNVGRAKMRHRRSRVTLMHSPRYQRLCGLIERNSRRDDLLYALLGASGLQGRLSVVSPALATGGHLRSFHDRAYVEALRSPPSDPKALEEFGLLDDCEAFVELYDYCCAVAGASIHAADRLCRGEADVAINWGGGRHHAKKGEAAGFCYVNDGVLAVLHLIKTFSRVLTIDIDVHHGDGIQEAFYMSDKVMTVSFHHLAKGFFPGAGHCFETGAGSGKGFNLNVPLKEGCRDTCFLRMFMGVVSTVVDGFQPEAVVILCGADTLSSDPLGPFNLTSVGIRDCVGKVVGLGLPLLMLGGGGYCPTDTARLWTTLTAAAVGPEAVAALPAMIPDHAYFPLYGPDFRMATRHKLIPDKNDEAYLTKLCEFVAKSGRRARTIRQSRESHAFQEYTDNGGSW